ncbi:uracil-DNA glycosylase family protein [Halanaerobium congolense]|uniref:uracil-DNA glycosylase family protein n=1 Tax=Halanaerobium congolense TaxID=54121 RepID=UPI00105F9E55|nr:uracil-DNA glycosylase family protein [Halanaerobium congolense]TDP11576.1 uracil DNA glycosylase superfamily protein [Halanaerobium congolense]
MGNVLSLIENEVSSWCSKNSNKLDKFIVEDLYSGEDVEILFILESPHTDEVKYQYPVAGNSGREMSDILFNRGDIPIGFIVKHIEYMRKEMNIDLTKNIGIMNVSQLPLQLSTYEDEDIELLEVLSSLNFIKKAITKDKSSINTKHRNNFTNSLKKIICDDFEMRLTDLIRRCNLKLIIPCGNFAQSFLEKFFKENQIDHVNTIWGVPHPSRGLWRQKEYKGSIKEIKKKL